MVPLHDAPSNSSRSAAWPLEKGISEDLNAFNVFHVNIHHPCPPTTHQLAAQTIALHQVHARLVHRQLMVIAGDLLPN